MNERFNAIIGARINEFMKKIKEVDAAVKKAAMGTDVQIGADTAGAMRKMLSLQAVKQALDDRVVIPISVASKEAVARIDLMQKRIDSLATRIRSLGTVLSNQLFGSLLALSPTLSPIISTLVGALGNLGPMIGTIAGSTFALATAFGFAGTAAVGFGFAAVPTIKAIMGETENLTKAQAAARAEYDKTGEVWKRITKSIEQPVIDGFTKAMQIAQNTLKSIEPMFINTAEAVNDLLDSLNREVKGKELQRFFDVLNEHSGTFIKLTGEAIGLFGKGFMNMMVAFTPLALDTAKGFRDMAERFAEWANGLSESKKFQSFVDYVKTNMPKVRSIFRDGISGIIRLFAGFKDSSADMMDGLVTMMADFKKWASELGNNKGFQKFLDYVKDSAPKVLDLIGNLTTFIVNLGIGLAPVGSILLDLVNKFLAWTNNLMENNRVVGMLVSGVVVMSGLFMALVPTIISVVSLFGGFGAVVKGIPAILKKMSTPLKSMGTWFKNLGPTILNIGKNAIPLLVKGLGKIPGPVGWIITGISLLATGFISLYKNSETFRDGVQDAMSRLGIIFEAFKEVAVNSFETLKSMLKDGADFFKAIVKGDWKQAGQILKDSFSNLWNTIKENGKIAIGGFMEAFGTDILNWVKALPAKIKENVIAWTEAFSAWVPVAKQKVIEGLAEWAVSFALWFDQQKTAIAEKLALWWTTIALWFDEAPAKITAKLAAWRSAFTLWFDEQKASLTEKLSGWWTTIGTWFDGVPAKIREKLNVWGTSLSAWFNEKKADFTEWLSGWKTTISQWFDSLPETILSKLESWSNAMKTWTDEQNEKNKEAFGKWKDEIVKWFESIPDKMKAGFELWKSAMGTWFDNQKERITEKLGNWWDSISKWFTSIPGRITDALKEWGSSISSWFDDTKGNLVTKLGEWWTSIKEWFASIPAKITKAFESWWTAIKNWFTGVPDKPEIKNMGKNMIDKVSEGNQEKKQEFIDKLGQIIVDVAIAALGLAVVALIAAGREIIERMIEGMNNAEESLKSNLGSLIAKGVAKVLEYVTDFEGVGADLIGGLIKGIGSMAADVAEKAKSVVSAAITAAKKVLQVKSPSRVFMAIGRWVVKGFTIALGDGEKDVAKSGEALAEAAIPDLSGNIKENERQVKNHAAEIRRINEQAAKDAAEIEADKTWEIRAIYEKAEADKLSATKQFITDKRALEQMSVKDEIKIWEQSVKEFHASADAKREAQLALRDAKRAMDAEMLKMELDYIAEKKRLGEIGLAQEVRMLEELSTHYASHSTKFKQIEEQKASVLKQIRDKMSSINDEYLGKLKDVNDAAIAEEKRLNEAYEKSVDDRAKSLMSFKGLFDEFTTSFEGNGHDLMNNLQGQVDGFKKWADDIAALAERGIGDGLLAELRAMGPAAMAEIAALNNLSDVSLSKYERLWKEKSELAREQAIGELEGMREDTQKQIEALHHKTADQLNGVKQEWADQIAAITAGTKEEMDSLEQIGADAVAGMIKGMMSMESDLIGTSTTIANTIYEAIRSALDIHSPSRKTKPLGAETSMGVVAGMLGKISEVRNAAQRLAMAAVPQNLSRRIDIEMNAIDVSSEIDDLARQVKNELAVKLEVNHKGLAQWSDSNSGSTQATTQTHHNTFIVHGIKELREIIDLFDKQNFEVGIE